MVLAISGSGRKNRIIYQTVKIIAEQYGEPHELISLSGKRIGGCIGCVQCASDNICKVKDDWNEIGEKMKKADVIILGAPNYYGMINALSHACLERTFSFRHRSDFSLQGKLGVIVTTVRDRDVSVDPVKTTIEMFMKSNLMEVIGHVSAIGYDQCYTCGYGGTCVVGNVVKKYGVIDEIPNEYLPKELECQSDTLSQIEKVVGIMKGRNIGDEK